jgi:glycine cleavage system H lipoate-binding protein
MADVTRFRRGETVRVGEACGGIGSVRSVSDLIAPVTGAVRTRNDDLARTPELVNTDSYAPAGCSRPRSIPPH